MIESGEFNKVNGDLRSGLLFAKVAEEMLERNILQKFNTNAKHPISVSQCFGSILYNTIKWYPYTNTLADTRLSSPKTKKKFSTLS
jgi:hypothetical protein